MFDLMVSISRMFVTFIVGLLLGVPILSIPAEAFDGEFVLEAQLYFFGGYRSIYVSPAGDKVCVAAGSTLYIVDVETQAVLVERTLPGRINRGCWAGDLLYFVSISEIVNPVTYIVVLDPEDLSEVTKFRPPGSSVHAMAASPIGDRIAVTTRGPGPSQYPELYVLRTSDNEVEYTFQDDQSASHAWIAWSPLGDWVISVTDDNIYIHDVGDGSTTQMNKRIARTEDLVLTPDGDALYSINQEGNIDHYDLVKREHVDTTPLTMGFDCGDIDFQKGLLCTGEWADLRLYSLDTFEELEHHSEAGDDVTQVRWLVEGHRILTISQDGFLRFYQDTSDPTWNTAPVITITSPTWGQEILGDLDASGTITDDGSYVLGSYSLNKGPWTPLENPEVWSFEILAGHMVHGYNQLTVTASDGESESTKTVLFSFTGSQPPNVPPTVEILSPVDGSEVGEVVAITGTASDDSAVTSVLIQIGDGPWTRATGKEEWDHIVVFPPDIDGNVAVRAKASDGSLISQVAEIELFLKRSIPPVNTPPRVILELPLNGTEVMDTLVCKGITEDEGMIMTFIAFDGGAWTLLSTTRSWESSFPTGEWTEGPHSISFMAFDGELSSDVIMVRVAKVNYSVPLVHILEPTSGERFSEPLTISGNAIAGLGKIIRVEIKIDSGTWMLAEGKETWSFLLDPDAFPFGGLTVEARAWDERTNSTITTIDIFNEGETPREGEPDHWWVWLMALVLVGVVAIRFWSRRDRHSRDRPGGPRMVAILVMGMLLASTIALSEYGSAMEHENDFQVVEEVSGIRAFEYMFLSPDHRNICIVNKSWDPRGCVIRIYNFTESSFVVERRLPYYTIQDGCWVGDTILLSIYPYEGYEDIEPILVLSAHDLSTVSFEDPDDTDEWFNFRQLVVSPSGDAIAAYGSQLVIFDSSDFSILHHFKDDDWYRADDLAWSPDGKRVSLVEDSIWIYDLETNTSIETQSNYLGYERVMWSFNGSWIYVGRSGKMHVYDIATDEFVLENSLSQDFRCWASNFQSNEMIWGDGGSLGISSLEDLSFVTKFKVAVGRVESVIWDLDGYRIIIMTDKGVMRIFLGGNDPQVNPPPEINILHPLEGEEVTGDIVAEGTVMDDEQILSARYRLNDGDWGEMDNPLYWSVDLSFADMVEGNNTLTVSASDGWQTSTRSVTFHVDPVALHNEPPIVSISSPHEGDEVGVLIEVEGTASDDHGVTIVLVRMSEGKWTLARGTTDWSATLVVPPSVLPGQVTIEARAWDDRKFSQVVGVNVTLVLDGSPLNDKPKVTIVSPTEGEVIQGDVTIRGRTDDDSDIVNTLVAINGGPLETLTTEAVWEKGLSYLGPGEHSVSVIASDGLLVSGVATVNFTLVAYEEMHVIISSPEDATEVSEEFLVTGVVLGGFGELVSVEIRLDGGEWTEIGPGRSWQTSLSLDIKGSREHFIEVRAWDEAEASKVANITVLLVIDEEGPKGPSEPDNVYIWVILVIMIVFIIAVWRSKQPNS